MPYWLIGGAIAGGLALAAGLLLSDEEEEEEKPSPPRRNPRKQLPSTSHHSRHRSTTSKKPSLEQRKQRLFRNYVKRRGKQVEEFFERHNITDRNYTSANRYADPQPLLRVVTTATHAHIAEQKNALARELDELKVIDGWLEELDDILEGREHIHE